MVAFRRVVTVLAVLTLFVGLASAQNQLTCSTNVSVTPQLRGEGYTEETGDFTITCTGGQALAVGSAVPQVNLTIFYNTTVTSRLLGTGTTNVPTEALLLIDEPGAVYSWVSEFEPPAVALHNPASGLRGVCRRWQHIPSFPELPTRLPTCIRA